jgi:hypothetical protein
VRKANNDSFVSRQAWLIAAASLSAGALLRDGYALAQSATLSHHDEKSPIARSLVYVADAAKVSPKTEPTFKVGSRCANCLQLQGSAGEAWRPCALFPGQLVSAIGWCRVWVPKPNT